MALHTDTRDALREKLKTTAAKKVAPPALLAPLPGTPLWDFHAAAEARDLPAIKDLFQRHPSLKAAATLGTVLLNGVQASRHDIIDYALAEKADVNFRTTTGVTALQMAVWHGDPDMFLKLLRAGGDPQEKNAVGKTLRQQAKASDIADCEKIVKILDDKKLLASLGHGPQVVKPAPR